MSMVFDRIYVKIMTSENTQGVKSLKELIKRAGYNQRSFAHATGIKEVTINNWVYGKNIPRLDNAILLAEYLKVDLVTLAKSIGLDTGSLPVPESTAQKKDKKILSVTRYKKNTAIVLPTTGLIETYSPNTRDCEYYRYTYREGTRVRHIHIKGGQVGSYHAENNAQEIKNAIARGCSVVYIKEIIKNQS
jgi:transcriptional regulator with XRE-family HTH domain